MTNETSAERVQRRWDEGAPERAARRERMAQANPVRRGLDKLWAAVKVLLLVSVLLLIVVFTIWFVWYVVTGVISADWERAGG